MFRQAIVLAVLLSSILITEAGEPLAGGFAKVPPNELGELQTKLQNSNFQTALGVKGSDVKVLKIDSASQQVVAGMNYKIKATILENGRSKTCCFFVEQSLPQKNGKIRFNVTCAQCGPQCECNRN